MNLNISVKLFKGYGDNFELKYENLTIVLKCIPFKENISALNYFIKYFYFLSGTKINEIEFTQ